ncbi:hypothetical protein [Roseateles violae]|uniref:Uncharacterized protein n=1 Tax=Roseateles violae TaxID=3058042 RepID=A0ABT8DT88_9BURK|nr:hypothetical protein [Pelomonas sp. PFR6]MDN3921521.1 hypothetical protein [Pelomonas sp. PFR6]
MPNNDDLTPDILARLDLCDYEERVPLGGHCSTCGHSENVTGEPLVHRCGIMRLLVSSGGRCSQYLHPLAIG